MLTFLKDTNPVSRYEGQFHRIFRVESHLTVKYHYVKLSMKRGRTHQKYMCIRRNRGTWQIASDIASGTPLADDIVDLLHAKLHFDTRLRKVMK